MAMRSDLMRRASTLLNSAIAINGIEFYVFKSSAMPEKEPELCCRIGSTSGLRYDDLEKLANDLNAAIESIKSDKAEQMKSEALELLK